MIVRRQAIEHERVDGRIRCVHADGIGKVKKCIPAAVALFQTPRALRHKGVEIRCAGRCGASRSGSTPRWSISLAMISGSSDTPTATGSCLRNSFLRMRNASSSEFTTKSTTPWRMAWRSAPALADAASDAAPAMLAARSRRHPGSSGSPAESSFPPGRIRHRCRPTVQRRADKSAQADFRRSAFRIEAERRHKESVRSRRSFLFPIPTGLTPPNAGFSFVSLRNIPQSRLEPTHPQHAKFMLLDADRLAAFVSEPKPRMES